MHWEIIVARIFRLDIMAEKRGEGRAKS
jgi:hypothetical protein